QSHFRLTVLLESYRVQASRFNLYSPLSLKRRSKR
ncbi:glycine betaine ABC transporter, glycine betaine-binding domain protein, partial [Vibrio parahaemolyticus V-223/04]